MTTIKIKIIIKFNVIYRNSHQEDELLMNKRNERLLHQYIFLKKIKVFVSCFCFLHLFTTTTALFMVHFPADESSLSLLSLRPQPELRNRCTAASWCHCAPCWSLPELTLTRLFAHSATYRRSNHTHRNIEEKRKNQKQIQMFEREEEKLTSQRSGFIEALKWFKTVSFISSIKYLHCSFIFKELGTSSKKKTKN